MAKVLIYTKYHNISVAEHRHHHSQQKQQEHQLLQNKPQAHRTTTNQCNNDNNNNNNKKLSSFRKTDNNNNNNNKINIEFINYKKLQKNAAEDQQQPNFQNNKTDLPQLTSVSSFSVLSKRNSKNNNSCNLNRTSLASSHSLTPSSMPPSTTCSYSLAPFTLPTSTAHITSTVAVYSSTTDTRHSSSFLNLSSFQYSSYSKCCISTYKLFTTYADAAKLQLKRKTQFKKLLYVNGHSDMRSICCLILIAFFYCVVQGTVAANITQGPTLSSQTEEFNTDEAIFYSNLTTTPSTRSTLNIPDGRSDAVQSLLVNNSSSKFSSSLFFSNDTLTNYQRRLLIRRAAANVPGLDDDDSSYHEDELDEYEILINNKSALGKYIGAPCNNSKCESTLLHVSCEKDSNTCGCEKNYPVQLGLTRGCDKPKKIGEQCFYDETCQYNDENSLCVQVRHNAMCQCASGFHSVSYAKPTRRVFCTQDIDELNSDLPTLLGVCVGIGVLAGLICMVLHLFSKTKYPRHRNFGDANLPPPIMYSSETGIPLTVQSGRPSSRSSIRSSGGSIGSYGNRRSSTGGVGGSNSATSGSKGILVSTSRTGSRRPSLASVHSTSSSVRSYSMMRFEKEQQQKEIRQEMKLRLARLQQHQQQQQHQQHMGQYKPQIIIGDTAVSMQHGMALSRVIVATPSPITPNSTDELLPALDENQEYQPKIEMTTKPDLANAAAYIGPCSSSNEAL